MRIKCIENNINNFSNNQKLYSYLKKAIHLENGIISISKNKEYNVYGVKYERQGFLKFLICNDDFSFLEYPLFYLSDFFEIVNDKASLYWSRTKDIELNKEKINFDDIIIFKEWYEMDKFYENLIDGSNIEKNIFLKYKNLMDSEFSE